MAVINTGLLEAGLKSDFFARFDATPSMYEKLCTRVGSTLPSEKYRWLGTVPGMREWGRGRAAKGLRSESYDVDNLKYEATIEVDRDEIDDDQTGQIRVRIAELAVRAKTHKDYLIGQLLENGGSSGYISYDGLTFFNDAHVSGASGSNDNDTTSAAATDTTPTTAELIAAIKLMTAALVGFKDDQGLPLNLGLSGLQLIVPGSMYWAAMEAMGAAMVSMTSNVLAGAAQVLMNPYLTSTDHMYLAKCDGVIRPFLFQDRMPIEFGSIAEKSEQEFKQEKYLYGVRARYAVTYGEPLTIVRHTFT